MNPQRPVVATIGVFDGVHIGHQAIVARARRLADRLGDAATLVAAFDPHPLATLAPQRTPAALSTFAHRRALLQEAGADAVVPLLPTRPLLEQSPETFLQRFTERFHVVGFVEGEDFRFGKDRAGDVQTLQRWAKAHAMAVEVVPPVEVDLTDQRLVRASSSLLRWLVEKGRVSDARRLLGRHYCVAGTVLPGDKRGRELGFPTANIDCPTLLPGDGVYAGFASDPTGRLWPAALSVGSKPSFPGGVRTLEAHLLGWNGALDQYGWPATVHFLRRLRDQARYRRLEALVEQMRRDCARVHRILSQVEPPLPCPAEAAA
ncbi:MAG: bifunctional riboflavin kinase/FMN adenylyltransferase [Planctomycetota bacterium]|nr:MAG: bifunctional riboflavin kinase/FMN adenylyltransferase [Planctomycetota bacterium]